MHLFKALLAATSSRTRLDTSDALGKDAHLLRSITLHGSAPARHQVCRMGLFVWAVRHLPGANCWTLAVRKMIR